jgi:hypothetical protein
MLPNHVNLYGLVTSMPAKPYEFIGSGGFYFAKAGISQFESFGSSSKHAEIGPESFGIFVRRFVGTVPDLLGLAWPALGPHPVSKISGRILKKFGDPFSPAEMILIRARTRPRSKSFGIGFGGFSRTSPEPKIHPALGRVGFAPPFGGLTGPVTVLSVFT